MQSRGSVVRICLGSALALCCSSSGSGGVGGVPCSTGQLFITPALQTKAEWYAKHFEAAGERNLCESAATENEVYRFTWLRTFHDPITIRISKTSNGAVIIAKRLDGSGGYAPGTLAESRSRELSRADWLQFQQLLQRLDYWSDAVPEDHELGGLDGAQWILEGVRGDTYRALDRWSPERRTIMWNAGTFLLDKAEMLPEDKALVY